MNQEVSVVTRTLTDNSVVANVHYRVKNFTVIIGAESERQADELAELLKKVAWVEIQHHE